MLAGVQNGAAGKIRVTQVLGEDGDIVLEGVDDIGRINLTRQVVLTVHGEPALDCHVAGLGKEPALVLLLKRNVGI